MSDPRYSEHPPWPPTGPHPPRGREPNRSTNPYDASHVGYAGGWDANVYGSGPAPSESNPWPWIALGAGVLVVVLLLGVAAAVLLLRDRPGGPGAVGGGSPTVGPSTRTGGTPSPSLPAVEVPPETALPAFEGQGSQAVGRVEDREAGLSYPELAAPWKPMARPWGDFSAGQEFVTERGSEGRTWHATVFSGPLPEDVQAYCSGPGTLPEVAAAAAQRYADSYYPGEYERTDLASQELEIGGHPAYLIGFELTFDEPYAGMTVTKETAVVAAVDTGQKYPGVLYVSVPGSHYELRPDINTVLDGTRVMGAKPTTGTSSQPTQAPTGPPMDGGPQGEEGCGAPKPSPSSRF